MEFFRDPDWSEKIEVQRFSFKRIFFLGLIMTYLVKRRLHNVAEFDRQKRYE